jgi:hypothetical protein
MVNPAYVFVNDRSEGNALLTIQVLGETPPSLMVSLYGRLEYGRSVFRFFAIALFRFSFNKEHISNTFESKLAITTVR